MEQALAASLASACSPFSAETETLINPVSIRKQTHQGRVLEEIQAVQGLPGGSSGGSSGPGGSLEDAQVSVAGPLSSDEFAFPQESYVRWSTHQYANCCQLVSSRGTTRSPSLAWAPKA